MNQLYELISNCFRTGKVGFVNVDGVELIIYKTITTGNGIRMFKREKDVVLILLTSESGTVVIGLMQAGSIPDRICHAFQCDKTPDIEH